MDKATRNLIQRATQDARRLMETEFSEQLEGTFDILPDGKIPDRPGAHLDDAQKLTRGKLVAAVEHKRAGGLKPADAIAAYLREAAFTCLNRFAALKMLEARGLVQECISKGEKSAGFKEFSGLAPGLVALPDHGYRMYLDCIFDEIGTEVKVLFDRRDPASLLWPRRQALFGERGLLGILNRPELAGVWGEDETIGWVYQYFNNSEDRKSARYDANGKERPPANSRELAVRNQFFTPRYVVQFLTDNTLGRIWYEMREGHTRLVDKCECLVRRPNEVFLAEGEEAPEQDVPDDSSQEELLKLLVHIPHRPKKDPRDLKILDPACGSGHFLLYCFDLLVAIYEEAWTDDNSPPPETTGNALRADYPDMNALRGDMPGLILRHNLYGIEIDPRCAQIAALSLWMRAQRAFNDFGCPRNDRPRIGKTNIVVAEPMPGEKDMLQEFTATLNPPLLGQLVEVIFEKMKLAGEAGSLLRIEEEIAGALAKAQDAWAKGPQAQQLRLFGHQPARQQQLDFSGIDDQTFWHQAEERIYEALRDYAERAANGRGFGRRLFAEDAERSFAFIDLCRQRYEAVLMNPPFGDEPSSIVELIARDYGPGRNDIYTAFVLRGMNLAPRGCVGAITSRSFVSGRDHRDYRAEVLREQGLSVSSFLDLGPHVLDEAGVETAAYTLASTADRQMAFLDARALDKDDLPGSTVAHLPIRWYDRGAFLAISGAELLCDLSPKELAHLAQARPIEPDMGVVTIGLTTKDNFRFVRLRWEVPPDDVGPDRTWTLFSKGGDYSWFTGDSHLVVRRADDGREMAAEAENADGNIASTRRSSRYYFMPALTFSRRSQKSFSARRIRSDVCFSDAGGVVVPRRDRAKTAASLMLTFASTEYMRLIGAQSTFGHYEISSVKKLPIPDSSQAFDENALHGLLAVVDQMDQYDETCQLFRCPRMANEPGISELTDRAMEAARQLLHSTGRELSQEVLTLGLGGAAGRDKQVSDLSAWLSYAVGIIFARWDMTAVAQDFDGSECLDDDFAGIGPSAPGELRDVSEEIAEHSGPGIAVFDHGHPDDIVERVMPVLTALAGRMCCEGRMGADPETGTKLLSIFQNSFFKDHIARYSASKRSAPVYWQLATSSHNYAVWLYYHRFTRDTFYKVLNDYVKPKLAHEQQKLASLTQQAGSNPTTSQRREIAAQQAFVEELRAFREELERIAPLWNPDLNDGVIINFAPLWRLVPQHRQWQKECKSCWDRLITGDYDWAHLAMHLWPERVVPKCHTDRSLAIAHDLEDDLWEAYEDDRGREQWRPKDVPKERIKELIAERTSPAVKAALESLLNAPAPAGGVTRRRGKGRRKVVK